MEGKGQLVKWSKLQVEKVMNNFNISGNLLMKKIIRKFYVI